MDFMVGGHGSRHAAAAKVLAGCLGCSATIAVLLALQGSAIEGGALATLRLVLPVIGGALFLCAGLLRMSTTRGDDPARTAFGAAMVVFGAATALLSGLGPLVHGHSPVAELNPYARATVAAVTITTAAFGLRTEVRPGPAASRLVLGALACSAGAFGLLVVAAHFFPALAHPSLPELAAVQASTLLVWVLACVAVLQPPWTRSGDSAVEASVVACVAAAAAMRLAALADPLPSIVGSALTVVAAALVALTSAVRTLGEAEAAERARLAAMQTALRAAAHTLSLQDIEQRDMRHGARNAICALRMVTQMLAERGDSLDAETRRNLRAAVLEEVAHLDRIINPAPRDQCATMR